MSTESFNALCECHRFFFLLLLVFWTRLLFLFFFFLRVTFVCASVNGIRMWCAQFTMVREYTNGPPCIDVSSVCVCVRVRTVRHQIRNIQFAQMKQRSCDVFRMIFVWVVGIVACVESADSDKIVVIGIFSHLLLLFFCALFYVFQLVHSFSYDAITSRVNFHFIG